MPRAKAFANLVKITNKNMLQTARNSSGKCGIYLFGVKFYGRLVMALPV